MKRLLYGCTDVLLLAAVAMWLGLVSVWLAWGDSRSARHQRALLRRRAPQWITALRRGGVR